MSLTSFSTLQSSTQSVVRINETVCHFVAKHRLADGSVLQLGPAPFIIPSRSSYVACNKIGYATELDAFPNHTPRETQGTPSPPCITAFYGLRRLFNDRGLPKDRRTGGGRRSTRIRLNYIFASELVAAAHRESSSPRLLNVVNL